MTIVGIARFPAYLPGHPDSDNFSPNSSWKYADAQAGLEQLGWTSAGGLK